MSAASKTATAVVSASMAILATQAMAHVARESSAPVELQAPAVDGALKARIDAAVAKRDARHAIAAAFGEIATGFGRDEQTLASKYFPGEEFKVATTDKSRDFTIGTPADTNQVIQCHNACHSACHGSRSWR